MNRTQRAILAVAGALLLLSLLVPPVERTATMPRTFGPPQEFIVQARKPLWTLRDSQIRVGVLTVQCLAIAVAGGVAILVTGRGGGER